MLYSRISNVILATASVLALVACSSGESRPIDAGTAAAPPPAIAPIDTAVANALAAPATPMPAPSADMEKRLSQLEQDVAGIKSQMVLVRPILEKMPALQDKLGELVSELQRIDARVASAQVHADNMAATAVVAPAPAAVAVPEAPFKTAPKMAPIVEPASKPAAKAVIEPTSKPMTKAPIKADVKAAPMKVEAAKIEMRGEPVAVPPSQATLTPVAATPALVATPSQTTAPVAASAADLQHIRVGDDAEKTRVVLDLNRKVSYTYDLDNVEKILILDVDAPTSSAVASASFANSPLVSSYAAESVAGGKTRIVMQLRAPVKIANTSILPPNGDKGDRIVVDLVTAGQ